jgi:ABC-type glycerol-3-phosphate transport system substrate-binding protein
MSTGLPAMTATPSPNPNEILFLSWIFDDPDRRDALRTQFKGFHQSQTTYRIHERYIAIGDYATRVMAGVAAGGIGADVIMTYPELAPRLIKANVFSAVDDVAKNLKIADRIRPGVKSAVASGENMYGFDSVSVGFGLLYNHKRFADAGVKAPPSTPDEWVAVSQTVTDKTKGLFGFYASYRFAEAVGAWFAFQEFALPYDGKWAVGNKPLLTSDPILNGVRLFKRLYDVSLPQSVDATAGEKMFGDQNVTQILRESTILTALKSDFPDLFANLASAPVPWTTKKSVARVHPMSVVRTSKRSDAAKAWLNYLYTPENYVKLTIESHDFVPMYPITTDTPGMTAEIATQWREYLAKIPPATAFPNMAPTYVSPSDLLGDFATTPDELGSIVIKHLEDILVRNVPVDKAMEEAQNEAENLGTGLPQS